MAEEYFLLKGKRVLVAGSKGMVGSAIVRRLSREDCTVLEVSRGVVDLRNQAETRDFFTAQRPDAVFVAAAKVGGILANATYPADFIYENLIIEANVVEAAYRVDVRKLLFLGSSCIYPRLASQPIDEEALLTGPLEPTNAAYAIAKIAGISLCQAYRRQHGCDFISAMPTNLYGPQDNFDLNSSHVVPALIRKAHEAKRSGAPELVVWGSGTPRREFLHVDDCADALVHLMKVYSNDLPINIGCGKDLTIAELVRMITEVVGFTGKIAFDVSMPDGMPRKLLSVVRLAALGWSPKLSLRQGLVDAYRWYCENEI